MFWSAKKNKQIPDNIKGFNLFVNEERQALINIIKLNRSKYKKDEEVLQAALLLGLNIMEEIVTHQASYYREDSNKRKLLIIENK